MMREYSLAACGVLSVALLLVWRRGIWKDLALWLGLGTFAALTIAADVLLTHVRVFAYDPRFLSGIRIDRMPVEDLIYGIAVYLIAVAVWTWDRIDVG